MHRPQANGTVGAVDVRKGSGFSAFEGRYQVEGGSLGGLGVALQATAPLFDGLTRSGVVGARTVKECAALVQDGLVRITVHLKDAQVFRRATDLGRHRT